MKHLLIFLFALIIFISCAGKQPTVPITTESQVSPVRTEAVLISAIPDPRPRWTYSEPVEEGDYLFFIGISENHSLERDARNSARRDAVLTFAGYCGVEVSDLHQAVSTSFGLSSGISDPTVAAKQHQNQIIDAYVSRVQAREWYIEEWVLQSGSSIIERYYRVYVKSAVPKDEYYKVIQYKQEKEKQLESTTVNYEYRYDPVQSQNWEKELQVSSDANYYYFYDYVNTDVSPTENHFNELQSRLLNSLKSKIGIKVQDETEMQLLRGYTFDRRFVRTKYEIRGHRFREEQPIEYKSSLRLKISKTDYNNIVSAIAQHRRLGDLARQPIELQFALISTNHHNRQKKLSNNDVVYSGDQFRIYVESNMDCYLYIFNVDSSEKINPIFPYPRLINIHNPIRARTSYYIPPDLVYAFDDVRGKEIFYVFAFKEEVEDFNAIKEKIKDAQSRDNFLTEIHKRYNTRGVAVQQSNQSIMSHNRIMMPDSLHGQDYIMHVIELKHY